MDMLAISFCACAAFVVISFIVWLLDSEFVHSRWMVPVAAAVGYGGLLIGFISSIVMLFL